jgi:hypothetical protein
MICSTHAFSQPASGERGRPGEPPTEQPTLPAGARGASHAPDSPKWRLARSYPPASCTLLGTRAGCPRARAGCSAHRRLPAPGARAHRRPCGPHLCWPAASARAQSPRAVCKGPSRTRGRACRPAWPSGSPSCCCLTACRWLWPALAAAHAHTAAGWRRWRRCCICCAVSPTL